VLVNPVGGLITFVSLTNGMSDVERRETARRAVLVACVLALVFALIGELILGFFQITLDNLKVAGGVLLFVIALDMLQARITRESVTPEELTEAHRKEDISVFPLATPLLTGPGTLTTVVVLMRTHKEFEMKAAALGAIMLVFIITYFFFRFSTRLNRLLGVTVSMVVTRLMGLFLAALSVNFVSTGIWNIYQSFLK